MNDDLDPDDLPAPGADPATDRLRSLGAQPPADATRTAHVQAMAATTPLTPTVGPRREKRFGRLAVAGAAVVGFLVGSTGFAMAGALPDPAQDAASEVLAVVGLEVPKGKEGKRGPCVSAAAKETDPVAKQAAKDACPKGPFGNGADDAPGKSGDANGKSGEAPGQTNKADKADDPCKGKPPWAGKHDLTDEQVAAAKAERDACPEDADEPDEPDEPDEDDEVVEAGGG